MAARQQQQSDICTHMLYPEAVIPQASARRMPWGPVLFGMLIVVTAGIALAWSLGLAGLREAEPVIDDIDVAAPTTTPRSPYPADMPDLARHSVLPVTPAPPPVAEPAKIAVPPAVIGAPPLPAPLPKALVALRAERVRALPPPPPATKPQATALAKPLPDVPASTLRPVARATAARGATFTPRAAQPLSGPLAGLFGPRDYPPDARRNGERGDVTVRLAIGNNGRVSGCRVLAADASATLKFATCAILIQRARFAAATDAHGAATDGAFVQHVAWRLP